LLPFFSFLFLLKKVRSIIPFLVNNENLTT
jgi:hypothetical protein